MIARIHRACRRAIWSVLLQYSKVHTRYGAVLGMVMGSWVGLNASVCFWSVPLFLVGWGLLLFVECHLCLRRDKIKIMMEFGLL